MTGGASTRWTLRVILGGRGWSRRGKGPYKYQNKQVVRGENLFSLWIKDCTHSFLPTTSWLYIFRLLVYLLLLVVSSCYFSTLHETSFLGSLYSDFLPFCAPWALEIYSRLLTTGCPSVQFGSLLYMRALLLYRFWASFLSLPCLVRFCEFSYKVGVNFLSFSVYLIYDEAVTFCHGGPTLGNCFQVGIRAETWSLRPI